MTAVLIADGACVSHSEIERTSAGLDALLSSRGVDRGSVLAFPANPDPPSVELALALFHAGRPMLPLHARWTPTERAAALAAVPRVTSFESDEIPELLGRASRTEAPLREAPRAESLAAIVFTSGTSGSPRPVFLSRHAFAESARSSALNLGWRDDDRWLLSLPFAHVGGLSVVTRCLLARRTIVLSASEPPAVLSAIARHRVSLASLVPSQLHRLLEEDRENSLANTRALLIGGAALGVPLRREAFERGLVALASYGLSETCAQVAAQSPAGERDPESMDSGRPLAGVSIRIEEPNRDGVGRIHVQSPTLMQGVHDLETNDLGRIDEQGLLFVLGRADDVIITGGEKVHPLEIERAATLGAGIVDALACGLHDDRWGEIVALAVVVRPGIDPMRSLENAFAELAPYKRPRRIAVVGALPLGPSGKSDRGRVARELFG